MLDIVSHNFQQNIYKQDFPGETGTHRQGAELGTQSQLWPPGPSAVLAAEKGDVLPLPTALTLYRTCCRPGGLFQN